MPRAMADSAPSPAAGAIHIEPDIRRRLPLAARHVLDVVIGDGLVDRDRLRDRTGLSRGAVRRAVRRLRRDRIVDTRCSLVDSRTHYFFIHPHCVVPGPGEHAERDVERREEQH